MTSPSTTKTKPRVIALIAAAGQGTRLGAGMPKALVPLAGEPHGGTGLEQPGSGEGEPALR